MHGIVLRDPPARAAVLVGVALLGLTIALAVFIEFLAHSGDLGPPDDVPRAIAIPAVYATLGVLAILAARQGRRAVVLGVGLVCLAGAFLSAATVLFAIPGLILLALSRQIAATHRGRFDILVAAAVVVLVAGAAIALLGTTEGRCWEAHGSPADPTYVTIACSDQPVIVGSGDTFASGFDGGVLTARGAFIEAVMLLAAIGLVAATGRQSAGTREDRAPAATDPPGPP